MKSKYSQLKEFLTSPCNVSRIRKTSVIDDSIKELLHKGITRTGSSGYCNGKKYKDIWTEDIVKILTALKIPHKSGNDAPRGGANGEFVRITMPAFLKVVKKVKEEDAKLEEEERQRRIKEKQERDEERKKYLQKLEYTRKFLADYPELVDEYRDFVDFRCQNTTGSTRRDRRRRARKTIAKNIVARFPNANLSYELVRSVLNNSGNLIHYLRI